MVYRVEISKSAKKTIAEQKKPERDMLTETCDYLINFPNIPNVKKLKGEANSWRHRKGDWRILFALTHEIVDDKEVSVIIVGRISKRKDAY